MQGTGILPCRKSGGKKEASFPSKIQIYWNKHKGWDHKVMHFCIQTWVTHFRTTLEMLALSYKPACHTSFNHFKQVWFLFQSGWKPFGEEWMRPVSSLVFCAHQASSCKRAYRHYKRAGTCCCPHPKGGKLGSSHSRVSSHVHSFTGQHWANWVLRLESPYHLARLFTSLLPSSLLYPVTF